MYNLDVNDKYVCIHMYNLDVNGNIPWKGMLWVRTRCAQCDGYT